MPAITSENAIGCVTNDELDAFAKRIQTLASAYYAENFPSLAVPKVGWRLGARYARIVLDRNGQGSLHSFVDLLNGDILKGSWKGPVPKGVRGNLRDPHHMRSIDHHGPKYLR